MFYSSCEKKEKKLKYYIMLYNLSKVYPNKSFKTCQLLPNITSARTESPNESEDCESKVNACCKASLYHSLHMLVSSCHK